jgi:hypothetical protein
MTTLSKSRKTLNPRKVRRLRRRRSRKLSRRPKRTRRRGRVSRRLFVKRKASEHFTLLLIVNLLNRS